MLPPGVTADLAPHADLKSLQAMHPVTKTVALLMAGRCSCDLVRTRLADRREDERHLRKRYRILGISRPATIAALSRHRREGRSPPLEDGWRAAVGRFVAEHARNAGPTLYLLRFKAHDSEHHHQAAAAPIACSLSEVSLHPDKWLTEGQPVIVR